jgi:hypothetical protein
LDLRTYKTQRWGLASDPQSKDTLLLRASVTNTATFTQPYPLIKLVMLNDVEMPIALREFSPAEYLPSSASADRLMGPKQRVNVEIAIVDPGADAVGYDIFPCLEQSGGIVCEDNLPPLPRAN